MDPCLLRQALRPPSAVVRSFHVTEIRFNHVDPLGHGDTVAAGLPFRGKRLNGVETNGVRPLCSLCNRSATIQASSLRTPDL
jgi:hypothetical protein